MRKTRANDTCFRIYVADLVAYNNGQLTGGWLEPAEYVDTDDLQAAIAALLSAPDSEHAFHDSEGVKIREHESLDAVLAIAEAVQEWGCEKVQAAIDHGIVSDLEDINTAIAEHDGGEYDSPAHWAEEFISNIHDLPKLVGDLSKYFDYETYARDAALCGDVTFVTGCGFLTTSRSIGFSAR